METSDTKDIGQELRQLAALVDVMRSENRCLMKRVKDLEAQLAAVVEKDLAPCRKDTP